MAGGLRVQRPYYVCSECGQAATPWDAWAGLGKGHLSPGAHRLAVLAGGSWSFDQASARLAEFCGLAISDAVIRRASDQEGQKARVFLEESPKAVETVAQAKGKAEFSSDGTFVNTLQGWREARLSLLAKREAGEPAAPEEWNKRELPKAQARVALGHIRRSKQLGTKWASLVRRCGVPRGQDTSVVADGARWIWKQTDRHLPLADKVVDVYHVSEHFHKCGEQLFGQESQRGRDWAEKEHLELIRQGPRECLERLEKERRACRRKKGKEALGKLRGYLAANRSGLEYRKRLAAGLVIGSGQVEGACKNLVGRRLKINSARWQVARAENMLGLCCLHYSDLWEPHWQAKVN